MWLRQRNGIDQCLNSLSKHVSLESAVVGDVEETVPQFELRVRVRAPGFAVYLHFGGSAVHCVPHSAESGVNMI